MNMEELEEIKKKAKDIMKNTNLLKVIEIIKRNF